MSAATVERAGADAVARFTDRLAGQAATDLPDVTATPEAGGLRLAGPGLLRRWITDARIRGLALSAARGAS